jgi:flagellin FlaB
VTGLEAAIIMISFVVVASAFAFTMLNTGLFAAGQAGQTALTGVERAKGNIVPRGSMFATRGNVDVDGNNVIDLNGADLQAVVKVSFTVTIATAGASLDLTPPYTKNDTGTDPDSSGLSPKVTISLQTDSIYVSTAAWTVDFPGDDDGDYMLETGEQAEITVWLQTYDNANALWDLGAGSGDPYIDTSGNLLRTSASFTVQVLTPGGAALTLQRTTPKYLDGVMNLN